MKINDVAQRRIANQRIVYPPLVDDRVVTRSGANRDGIVRTTVAGPLAAP